MLPITAQNKEEPINVGYYENIYSQVLGEERTLLIKLPNNYSESGKRYPVIFQLDGYEQRYLSRLAEANRLFDEDRIPEFIYVAIANTDRNRDMFPFKTQYHPTSGGADNFIQFIHDELIPYIDKNYRTAPHKSLIGFSASGMFTFYYFLTQPETFDAYVLCSPSISFDTDYFIDKLEKFVAEHETMNKTLAIVYGGSEGNTYYGDQYYFDMHNCVREITNTLKSNSPRGLTWSVTSIEGGLHVPNGCVYEGLKKAFQDWQPYLPPEIIPAGGAYDFDKPLPVSITSTDGEIYFTLDGSEPTKVSRKYEEKFMINKPVIIKAKIFGNRYGESSTSEVEIKQYDLINGVKVNGQLSNGLKFNYYEDYYFRSRLPDFDALIPVDIGKTDRINLGMKKRDEGFAVTYEGFINIPLDGNYIFTLISNNESKLLIDNVVVVNKEYNCAHNELTGIISLGKGLHVLKLLYIGPPFMKKLNLDLFLEGPGLEKQKIPPNWLFHIE